MTAMKRTFCLCFSWILAASLLLVLPGAATAADMNTTTGNSTNSQIAQTTNEAAGQNQGMTQHAVTETKEAVADAEKTIKDAVKSFKTAMNSEKRIPKEEIANAKGIAIFPNLTQASFVVGGRYGEGVLMLKQQGSWTGPLFVNLYGASIGAQIGVEQTDLFMIFKTEKSLQSFKDGKLTLGAEASVAAGEWGAKAAASTAADVIIYKRTEGLFAGASLSGAIIEVDEEANKQFYSGAGNEGVYYGYAEVISGKNVPRNKDSEELILLFPAYE